MNAAARRLWQPSSGLRGALSAILPLLLGVGWLWLWEAGFQLSHSPAVVCAEPVGRAKLLALLVDSLDLRDVEAQRLPRLTQHLSQTGLHGPVRACADAITIPCVTALLAGADHGGPFSVLRNFMRICE